MATSARDHITLDVTGRDAEDRARIVAIQRAIEHAFGDRVGYQVLRLETPERIEQELRNPKRVLSVAARRRIAAAQRARWAKYKQQKKAAA